MSSDAHSPWGSEHASRGSFRGGVCSINTTPPSSARSMHTPWASGDGPDCPDAYGLVEDSGESSHLPASLFSSVNSAYSCSSASCIGLSSKAPVNEGSCTGSAPLLDYFLEETTTMLITLSSATMPTMLRLGGKSCILMTVNNYRYISLVGRVLFNGSAHRRALIQSAWILSCPTTSSP